MEGFPDIQTNLGKYADQLVTFLDVSLEGFFDFIFFLASRTINGIQDFLIWIPWWLFIVAIFLLGWYFKSVFQEYCTASLFFSSEHSGCGKI